MSPCESPIESRFLVGLVNACRRRGVGLSAAEGAFAVGVPTLALTQQERLVGHRVDFVVRLGRAQAVVECDGHDFHERTKTQAQHDRSMDRALQRAGFTILRFTGAEIVRNAEKCAVEVLDHLLAGA